MTQQTPDPVTDDKLTSGGTTTSVDTTPVTDVKDQQSTSGGEDWETRYKGQQKVMAKKDAQIDKLQKQLDDLAAQLEEIRPLVDTRTKEKGELEATRSSLEQQLDAAKKEAETIKRKLAHTAIIMQDYSHLAPLADYIPESEDEATFRESAKKFGETLQKVVDAEVKRVMAGAAPPQPKGSDGFATSAEEDELYRTVANLAGRPGKEKEYEAAFAKWMALQNSKQQRS